VSLTEAGRVLADYARRMVELRNDAVRHVSELKTLKAGTLAIAAHESAAVYLLPAPLRSYLERFPGHQSRDLSQPPERDSASGSRSGGGRRLCEGGTRVPRFAVGRSPRR
jgi:DNA-binding transcriptional LysR family regulator